MTTSYQFKKSIFFVVLYMVICDMTVSTLPNFHCDPAGDVILDKITDVNKTAVVNTDQSLCNPTKLKLITKCPKGGSKNIEIVYGNPVITVNNDEMVGGKNVEYGILSCEDKPFDAVATAKPFFVSTRDPATITKKIMPIEYAIKLSITGLSANPNGALLGDHLTLMLEGPDNIHSLHPKECKAFATSNNGNKHTIWERQSQTHSYCHNVVSSVIDDKWTVPPPTGTGKQNRKLSIGMYAFRFASSSQVTIECSAYVCPAGDTTDNCQKQCINDKSRRRRAIHDIQTSPKSNNTTTKIMVATTSFQVQLGDQNTGNSAESLSKNVQLYSVTSILVFMVTMMIR